jgi:hypothetical protein
LLGSSVEWRVTGFNPANLGSVRLIGILMKKDGDANPEILREQVPPILTGYIMVDQLATPPLLLSAVGQK